MQKASRQADLANPRPAGKGNESIFDIAVEMLYIALVFLAPVIFDRRVGIVFSLTKVTVVRVIIIAILTVWAIKIMLKQEHKFIRSPLDFPILSYFLVCTVAMLTSVHVLTSFMGFYGRYEGCSTLYMYCLLFFITTNFIHSKEQILRVMYTVIVAGVCMAVYGVIQRMGLDPYAWGGVVTWQRIIGTIGQPNFLAAYVDMAFIIGLSLLLNLKDIRQSKESQWITLYDVFLRAALIISLLLIYICVLYTQSRGGFIGLFVGVPLFFAFANRNLAIDKWKELLVLFLLIAGITVITSLNPETSPFGRVVNEAAKTGEMSASETTVLSYNATLSRFETWKSAYRIIADRPFFGIGQEVLKMVFPRYETNKFRFYEGFHVKQDRCHNEVCDMSVTRGVIGLAVYLWVLSTFFYLGIKIIRGDFDPELKLFTAGYMGAATAYLVQNQFSFGVVAITTLLWIMMGLTASIYVKPQRAETNKNVDLSNMPWLLLAVVLILALFMTYLSVVQFRADMHFKNGSTLTDMRRFDDSIREFETSLRISPYEGGTWTHYGLAVLNIALTTRDINYINKALGVFDIATKVDPYNADNFFIIGKINFNELHPNDAASLNKIIEIEKNAIKIDPLYAEAFQIIGAIYEKEGKYKDAAQMYEKSVEINPQLSDAVSALANIYIKLNEPRKIVDIFKEFLVKYPNNAVFQENLAAIYVRTGDINQAIKVYEDMVTTNPQNITALVNLGFMSARMGNMAKAKDSFERAYLIDPKNVNVHNGLGLVYLSTGQKDKAREEFNQTLMVDPNNQYAKDMLGRIK
jgi:tetratricopeptide (TPR) repeat protein